MLYGAIFAGVIYGYRYYSAELGRWISRDPIGEQGGNNTYAAVENDLINNVDIIGLWKLVQDGSHIWIAEVGDTLSSLASKSQYGGDAANWSCLWPVLGTKDSGYPDTVRPCDKYDASNLAAPSPDATSLQLIVDSKLAGSSYSSIFPTAKVVQGDQVASLIQSASGEGATPIFSFVIAGHGGNGGTVNGRESWFTVADLLSLNKAPKFLRAKHKKGPIRCWFTRDASARFSGCSSETIAGDFATDILRKGANAIGTTGDMATSMRMGKPYIHWNPVYDHATGKKLLRWRGRADYFSDASIWTTLPGEL